MIDETKVWFGRKVGKTTKREWAVSKIPSNLLKVGAARGALEDVPPVRRRRPRGAWASQGDERTYFGAVGGSKTRKNGGGRER